jgi:hypothetical protein
VNQNVFSGGLTPLPLCNSPVSEGYFHITSFLYQELFSKYQIAVSRASVPPFLKKLSLLFM